MKSESAFEGGEPHGPLKLEKPPLLGSARVTIFLMFLLATCNFVFQRFNINFGIVCMHRPLPLALQAGDDLSELLDLHNNGTINLLGNITHSDEQMLESSSLLVEDFKEHDLIQNHSVDGVDIVEMPSRCGKRAFGGNESGMGEMMSEFTWSKETKGGILAAFYYGLTFSQIPGGWVVDRFGAKSAILLSQLSLSILSLVNPIAANMGPQYMFVARLLQGVANGAAMPAINVLATRWSADIERSFLLGIAYAGFGIATAVVYPLAAFFCENAGWGSIFYFAGATGLLWCLAAYFLVFDWPENHPRIKTDELQFLQTYRAVKYGGPQRQVLRPPWKAMLLSVPVWAIVITNFCCFWCFLTISAYLPTYLTEVLNLDIRENGLLSSMPFVFMMTFHFLVAAFFDWLRRKNLCSLTNLRKSFNTFGFIASGISMIGLGLVPCDNILGAVILFTLCQTFLEFPLMGGYLFSIFEIAPKYASSLTALSNTFGLLTGFISPAFVSMVTPNGTREEWLLVFYTTAGFNIFGGLVYLMFGSSDLQPWAADTPCTVTDSHSAGSLSRTSSKRVEQEMKHLKIRLINGESDVNGQSIKS